MQNLNLITFNMHKGFSGDGRKSFVLESVRNELAKTDADIVFLQETVGKNDAHASRYEQWPENSQFEFIADSLWPHYAYGKNAHYQTGHHGNAILCKYPLVSWDNIDVSPYPFAASRSLLHAVIHILPNRQSLHLICVHLGFFGLERKAQMRTLCQHIDAKIPHSEPLIIAGDFNDWRGNADREFDQILGLREAHHEMHGHFAQGFPAWAPLLRLDRIYYRGLTVRESHPLSGNAWKSLSDHLPLRASFEIT